MKLNVSILFLLAGLIALLIAGFIGMIISIVYINPDLLKDIIPFNRLRPIHTTSAVSWIVLTATGGIYYYLTRVERLKLYSERLQKTHLVLFLCLGVVIYMCYIFGVMGGREYLEFLPVLIIPVLLGWVLFGINYFKVVWKKIKDGPVYFWMWGTGILFMIFHLTEAHFWAITDIRSDFIKDLTIQWKSYGSFVGSWNMLVYGTAIYLMSKMKKDGELARGKKVFFFYFLGLTNLMFGWAHHTYIVPTAPWIRYVAYGISMTEWILFLNIVYIFIKNLGQAERKIYAMPYRFLMASEFWVFVNLLLALLMSIPTINYYTHGTHITVAHSMGTTIGINTCILLASVSFIAKKLNPNNTVENTLVYYAFLFFNGSLFIFWLSLVIGGIYKAVWSAENGHSSFAQMHENSSPIFVVFILSGCLLFISLAIIVHQLFKDLGESVYQQEKK
ncbi:MAG: cbb3-type cytochrome c oxidase subunit I [Crocinitomicaceae bacterium]|nr:cbb3-type cytochrome c oxidase subunit I [Crocinitomicaceae bacterium]